MLEVLLIHPGGPFWRGKNVGAWQVPKSEVNAGEDAETTARREVKEELGFEVEGTLVPLGEIRQARGKHVVAFAGGGDLNADRIVSNMVEIDWPPRSGRRMTIPEIDAARWLPISEARRLMLPSQRPLLDALEAALGRSREPDPTRASR